VHVLHKTIIPHRSMKSRHRNAETVLLSYHERVGVVIKLPVLLNLEGPLEFEMSVVVIVDKFRSGSVFAADQHA